MGVSTLNSILHCIFRLACLFPYTCKKDHKNIFLLLHSLRPHVFVPWRRKNNNKYIIALTCFVLASLLHTKIQKNTWAHEGPHISEKTQKEVGT
jgi:uncharacterized membrane protein